MISIRFISIGIIISFLTHSCKMKAPEQDFSIKEVYNVQIGDTVSIYYTTNSSCCPLQFPNRDSLNNFKFIKTTVVKDSRKEHCVGCSKTYSMKFIAIRQGVDTLFSQSIHPLQQSTDTVLKRNQYILNAKK